MGNVLYQSKTASARSDPSLCSLGLRVYTSPSTAPADPRWLSVWGFIGVVTSMAAALLSFFHMDPGIGFYLEMVIAPQEIGHGGLAYREGIQSICDRCPVCKNRITD